jgi:hypothetical protein
MNKLKATPRPYVVDLQYWISKIPELLRPEWRYAEYEYDLFCVAPNEKTRLERLIPRLFLKTSSPFTNPHSIETVSLKAIAKFLNQTAIMTVGVGMLITPMWVLQTLTDPKTKLGVITVFVITFLLIVSFSTKAEASGTLAATAG